MLSRFWKNICSWNRKLSKKISKTNLKNYDQKLASKYIKLGEPIVRFKINDFRPYPFSLYLTMALSSYRRHRIYLAATMNYGLGSDDPEELAYYNKIRKEMDDMKKDSIKKGIPLNWDALKG